MSNITSAEELARLFTPTVVTAETQPRYRTVNATLEDTIVKVQEALTRYDVGLEWASTYQQINDAILEFATVINDNCPACADTAAAIQLVRLARMKAVFVADEGSTPLWEQVLRYTRRSLYVDLASAAILATAAIAPEEKA